MAPIDIHQHLLNVYVDKTVNVNTMWVGWRYYVCLQQGAVTLLCYAKENPIKAEHEDGWRRLPASGGEGNVQSQAPHSKRVQGITNFIAAREEHPLLHEMSSKQQVSHTETDRRG